MDAVKVYGGVVRVGRDAGGGGGGRADGLFDAVCGRSCVFQRVTAFE
jgi:hypothetical protein